MFFTGIAGAVQLLDPPSAPKVSNITVLAEDPQAVPVLKIKDVPVVATVLGGKVIPVSETKKPRPLN